MIREGDSPSLLYLIVTYLSRMTRLTFDCGHILAREGCQGIRECNKYNEDVEVEMDKSDDKGGSILCG